MVSEYRERKGFEMARRMEHGKMEWSNMTAILEAAYIFTRCESAESFAEEITKWADKHFYDMAADGEYLISEVEKAVEDAKYAGDAAERNYCIGKVEGLTTALETIGIPFRVLSNNGYEYSFELNGSAYRIGGTPELVARDMEEAC